MKLPSRSSCRREACWASIWLLYIPCSIAWNERTGSKRTGKPCRTGAAAAATGSPLLEENKSRRSVPSGVPFSTHYKASRGFKMPDWKQVVGKRLRVLGICSPECSEELAGHLEDFYEALLHEGVTPGTALHRTLEEVNRRSRIYLTLRILKEVLMTGFARKVGLPGL